MVGAAGEVVGLLAVAVVEYKACGIGRHLITPDVAFDFLHVHSGPVGRIVSSEVMDFHIAPVRYTVVEIYSDLSPAGGNVAIHFVTVAIIDLLVNKVEVFSLAIAVVREDNILRYGFPFRQFPSPVITIFGHSVAGPFGGGNRAGIVVNPCPYGGI